MAVYQIGLGGAAVEQLVRQPPGFTQAPDRRPLGLLHAVPARQDFRTAIQVNVRHRQGQQFLLTEQSRGVSGSGIMRVLR